MIYRKFFVALHFVMLVSFLAAGCGDDGKENPGGMVEPGSTDEPDGTMEPGGTDEPSDTDEPGGTDEPGSKDDLCAGIGCAEGFACSAGVCRNATGAIQGEMCRGTQCLATQTCIGGSCVERADAPSYVVGAKCSQDTFVERCDGNTAVYCWPDVDDAGTVTYVVSVSACDAGETCAVRSEANYSFCTKPDERCSAQAAGELTFCRVEKDLEGNAVAGATSYEEYFDCVPDTDGTYRMFRSMSNRTEECIGACFDDYVCQPESEACSPDTYEDHCDGDVAVICAAGVDGSYGTWYDNCADYGISCIMEEDGLYLGRQTAVCDWSSYSY